MKQHLNTLFVTTDGAYLAKQGQAVAVRIEKQTKLRLPLHNLDGIVCFGRIGCSPALMQSCAEAGVTLSLLDMHGRFRAAVVGFTPGNVLLRRAQYRAADDPAICCAIARNMIAAKLANARSVLLRGAREANNDEDRDALARTERRLAHQIEDARKCTSLEVLRGMEGDAANHYFGVFTHLLRAQREAFAFTSRSRRPPRDRVNCLLSFLYSLLAHDVRSACEASGLDAAVGFLHRDRPGRPGLALDLMEELRPFIVDRLVLSLVNRRQVSDKDFEIEPTGGVLLKDKARKTVLTAWQKRKQSTITHPYLNEKTTVGLIAHLQARLLTRQLRGDIEEYPPFLWR